MGRVVQTPQSGAGHDVVQPMPALSPEQRDALHADISVNGVLVPITVDQHGRIIDGNNRAAIAAELGVECPRVEVEVVDDDAAVDLALTLNCARRHLSREQVREIIGNELERRPDDSDRAIARRVGCSPSTVGAVRKSAGVSKLDRPPATREEALASTAKLRDALEQASAGLYAQVGLALENHISLPEVLGALTMARLKFDQHEDGDPEARDLFSKTVFEYVITVTSWPETVAQFPPHPESCPSPEQRDWLIENIVSMGLPRGEHPADVVGVE